MIKLGIYKHYKGNLYEVVGLALQTETREKLVLYKAKYPVPELAEEYGPEPVFARPFDMFMGAVEWEGETVPRFEFVEE